MATHPSVFAGAILWTEEPGGLQSYEQRSLVGYSPCSNKSWTDLVAEQQQTTAATKRLLSVSTGLLRSPSLTLFMASRKSEIPKEHFMQRWAR